MALIARGYPGKPKTGDLLIKLFRSLLDDHPEFRNYIPQISEPLVREIIAKLHMKVRTQAIVDLVMGRYELVMCE